MVIHVGFGIAHGSPILNQAVEFQLFGQLLGYEFYLNSKYHIHTIEIDFP